MKQIQNIVIGIILGVALVVTAALIKACDHVTTKAELTTDTIVVVDTIRDSHPIAVHDTLLRYHTIRIPVGTPDISSDSLMDGIAVQIDCTDREYDNDYTDYAIIEQDSDSVSIHLPIRQKEFTDSATYRVLLSGYKVQLDEIEVYQQTKTITERVTERVTERKPWGIGVTAGYGIGWDGLTPFVGVGVQYNIVRW